MSADDRRPRPVHIGNAARRRLTEVLQRELRAAADEGADVVAIRDACSDVLRTARAPGGAETRYGTTILRLLLREEWRGGPGHLNTHTELANGLAPSETVLVRAAAALGAGEPRRALGLLDAGPTPHGHNAPDCTAVERALRGVAATLERNWFPGGSGAAFDAADLENPDGELLEPVSVEATLVVTVANRFVTALPTWRSIATSSRRDGGPVPAAVVTGQAEHLMEDLARVGSTAAAAPIALALADLEVRAGGRPRAGLPLDYALQTYRALGDPVGVAACELVRGDWALAPGSHPELLGTDLEGRATGPVDVKPELDVAAERYGDAERSFAAGGSIRGVAAVCLRHARLADLRGDPAAATEALDRCIALADEAGDGALARLAAVHRALVAISAGEPIAVGQVGEEVGGWAMSVGSRSYACGLARLCHAVGRRWQERDMPCARRALQLAEAINDRVGAVTEPSQVRGEVAAQYIAANFRRAAPCSPYSTWARPSSGPSPPPGRWPGESSSSGV